MAPKKIVWSKLETSSEQAAAKKEFREQWFKKSLQEKGITGSEEGASSMNSDSSTTISAEKKEELQKAAAAAAKKYADRCKEAGLTKTCETVNLEILRPKRKALITKSTLIDPFLLSVCGTFGFPSIGSLGARFFCLLGSSRISELSRDLARNWICCVSFSSTVESWYSEEVVGRQS